MANAAKPLRILYFINGPVPTHLQRLDAETYGFGTVFRNASHVPASGALEACDAVAGDVHPRYAAAFPAAQKVMQRFVPLAPETPAAEPMLSAGEASATVASPVADAAPPVNQPPASKPGPFPVPPPAAPAWKPNQ